MAALLFMPSALFGLGTLGYVAGAPAGLLRAANLLLVPCYLPYVMLIMASDDGSATGTAMATTLPFSAALPLLATALSCATGHDAWLLASLAPQALLLFFMLRYGAAGASQNKTAPAVS